MDEAEEIETDVAAVRGAAARAAPAPAPAPAPRIASPAPPGPPPPAASGGSGPARPVMHTNRLFARLQAHFDVDTADVRRRSLLALNPLAPEPFLLNGGLDADPTAIVGGKQPDLWGPIWLYQTTVFAMFLSTTMAGMLIAVSGGFRYEYDIKLLTGAAFVVFFFTFGVPLALWLLIQFWNLMPSLTLVQVVSLYGYSNVVWAPIVLVMGSPLVSPLVGGRTTATVLRWVLAGAGFALSARFLGSNVHRVLNAHASAAVAVDRSKAMLVLALVLLGQAALGVLVVSMFSSAINYGPAQST